MIYESFKHEGDKKWREPYKIFMERVGIIKDYYELYQIGIDSDTLLGGFYSSTSWKLKKYCLRYSGYHIVSHFKGQKWLNRYEPGAVCYYLADGDDDPELELILSKNSVDQLDAMVSHVYTCLNLKKNF